MANSGPFKASDDDIQMTRITVNNSKHTILGNLIFIIRLVNKYSYITIDTDIRMKHSNLKIDCY